MNVSASKLWNESNHTKLNSVKNALTSLLPMMFNLIKEKMNEIDEVLRSIESNKQ